VFPAFRALGSRGFLTISGLILLKKKSTLGPRVGIRKVHCISITIEEIKDKMEVKKTNRL